MLELSCNLVKIVKQRGRDTPYTAVVKANVRVHVINTT